MNNMSRGVSDSRRRRPTLCFLAYHYPPEPSAAAERARSMVSSLSRKFDVTVIATGTLATLQRPGPLHREVQEIRANPPLILGLVDCIPILRLFLPMATLASLVVAFRLRKMLHRSIVFATVPPSQPLLSAYLCSRLTGSSLVVDVRDRWEDNLVAYFSNGPLESAFARLLRRLVWHIYRQTDFLVAVTDTLGARLRQLAQHSFVMVAYNGVQIEYARRVLSENRYLPNRTVTFLFNGHETPYYCMSALVDGFAAMASKCAQVKLILVGNLSRRTRSLVSRLVSNNASPIEYAGVVSYSESLRLLNQSDAICVPLREDELLSYLVPNKVLEACVLGRPVICSGPAGGELWTIVVRRRMGLWTHATREGFEAAFLEFIKSQDSFAQRAMEFSSIAERLYSREANNGRICRALDENLVR